MKALVKSLPDPGIWLKEIERPSAGPNDVLVRVIKASICGTDLHIVDWDKWAQATIPVPMAIGHEFVGVVEDVAPRSISLSRVNGSRRKVTSRADRAATAGRDVVASAQTRSAWG